MTAVPEMRQRVAARLGRELSNQEWGLALFLVARRRILDGSITEDEVYEQAVKGRSLRTMHDGYATEP